MSVNRFMAYGYDVDECGNMVGIEDYRKLQAENAALKEENERLKAGLGVCEYELMISTSENLARDYIALKARVAELEKEDTLWAMLDAIEKALFRRAAPHAWETIVTEAGMKFITDRRKEPANEG